jgi:MoxR-like ATPase
MLTELVESDTLVNELLLAVVSRGHLIAIGERGIAKTFAVDVFLAHMEDVRKFYALCSKSMPPEMLVGHLSIKRLAEDDVLAYNIAGKLPDTEIAVLDEGFKNNAVNLNALLGIINERRFVTNGHIHDCPLWSVVLTSNLDEYQITGELAAFRDRFGAALHVEAVKSDDGFRRILEGQVARFAAGVNVPQATTMMTRDEIVALQNACREVTHPTNVLDALVELRKRADLEGLRPSARRYGQLMQRMSAQAILNGRSETRPEDLTLAQHSLWTDLEDKPKAYELIVDFAGQAASVASKLRKTLAPVQETLSELGKQVDPSTGRPPNDSLGTVAEVLDQVKEIKKQIDKARGEAANSGEDTTELDALDRDQTQVMTVVKSYLGINE